MKQYPFTKVLLGLLLVLFSLSTVTDGKGFGGGRGGGFGGGRGSFGGGSKGGIGGLFGGSKGSPSKGSGAYGGSSGLNRAGGYGSYGSGMGKGSSGSGFRGNAMSFGAGALGGLAAYSVMSSMAHSYHARPGYYDPGYGTGARCYNNEDINGTRFDNFRCPLNGFPLEARYCCGEYGRQYCCTEDVSGRFSRSGFNFGWILFLLIVVLIAVLLYNKHRRQSRKDVILVPMEPPINEQSQPMQQPQGPPYYRPPPPPMGYPPAPSGNPYAPPAQHFDPHMNPYIQQQQQQQSSYDPHQVKEAAPPAYDEVIRNNQDNIPTAK